MTIGGRDSGARNLSGDGSDSDVGGDGGDSGTGGIDGKVDCKVIQEGGIPVSDGGTAGARGMGGDGSEEEGAGGMHERGESCSTSSSPSSLSSSASHNIFADLLVAAVAPVEQAVKVVQAVAVAPHSPGEGRRSCSRRLLASCLRLQLRW